VTARDRWTEDLKCPTCGLQGIVSLSEADGWEYQHNQSTTVDECPDGFRYEKHQNKIRFFCIADGAQINR